MTTKATILLVEDEQPLRQALLAKLRSEGYRVLWATDGRQALELVYKNRPALMLLDIGLPGLNGHEVIADLRTNEWGKLLPIIILTNDSSDASIKKMTNYAAPAYFIKSNTSLSEVASAVSYHLELYKQR